jgi:hypothetical protein
MGKGKKGGGNKKKKKIKKGSKAMQLFSVSTSIAYKILLGMSGS